MDKALWNTPESLLVRSLRMGLLDNVRMGASHHKDQRELSAPSYDHPKQRKVFSKEKQYDY